MRRSLLCLIVVLALAACRGPAARPDPQADLAAYRALIPAGAPAAPDLSAAPADAVGAFDFGKRHILGGMGWWYFNAHLLDENDRRWTVMFAILRDGQIFGSVDAAELGVHAPLYRRSRAKIDIENRRVSDAEDRCRLSQPEAGQPRYAFALNDAGVELTLDLSAIKPPIPVHGDGNITMGHTGQSKYFILPQLAVTGEVRTAGQTGRLRGLGWMDHQYGSWNQIAIERWTWHAIHLTDGREIMIYDIYKTGGAAEHLCDIVGPDGALQANQRCDAKPTRQWKSPRTGRKWAAAWRIEIPALAARLQLTPDSDDREVSEIIYEGGCAVTGEAGGRPIAGRSFYEEHQRLPVAELKKLAKEQKGKK